MTEHAEQPETIAALVARINGSYARVNELIGGLSEGQLTVRAEPSGWSVKDHVAHLTAWEQSLLGLLAGLPRWQVMGVSTATWDAHDVDAINAAIAAQGRDRSTATVLADFHATHQQMIAALERLTDADLLRPYAHFQPNEQPPELAPVAPWIHNNSWAHLDEHRGWIAALLKEHGAERSAPAQ
ncbi:MAG TPA: ClbS/DfsB family four-helix bundle protein [Dehalococcoidia bacterium]|jgi:hypothetical protein